MTTRTDGNTISELVRSKTSLPPTPKCKGHISEMDIIKKLWDMAWDICNQHNHILHTPEGPVKNYRLEKINTRLRIYHARGMSGLPIRCQLLFHTNYHYLDNASSGFQKFPMQDSSYNETHLQGDKNRTLTYKS